MGVWLRDQHADVYNVILGLREFGGRGVMSQAFRMMCSYAQQHLSPNVTAQVLKNNPAVGWYVKCGFDIVAEESTHYQIQLSADRFMPVPVTVQEEAP